MGSVGILKDGGFCVVYCSIFSLKYKTYGGYHIVD